MEMRLGTKLLLAFFLLAVLPLAWITIHSYSASITAFRSAVEAESGSLAEEMGGRMQMLRTELAFRIERLGRFPFEQLMAVRGERVDSQSNPLVANLMAEIGDSSRFVDTIEFSAAGSSASTAGTPGKKAAPPASGRRGPPMPDFNPQHLVIQLSQDMPPPPPPGGQDGQTMHFRPRPPDRAAGDNRPPMSAEEKQKREARLKQIQEFQVVLEKFAKDANPATRSDAKKAAAPAAKMAPFQASRMQRANPLANNFGSEVQADGRTVGTVRARISPGEMFRNVLSGGRHRKGDIAFVIDSDGKLFAASQAEEERLAALGLPPVQGAAKTQSESTALKDWVVVTRKDEASNVTFGIAQPVSESLRGIRNTAVRNLFYGLGLVGLALIGIIPISHGMTRNLAVLSAGAEQLAHGNLDVRLPIRSHDEIGRLTESFNRMAHDLKENQKNLVEQERMRKELEMSRRIQEELLPKRELQSGPIEVMGISIPAREVGGDFFNYFPLANGEIGLLVGDVSGKGIAAALLMANVQATLQARLPLVQDLAQLATQLDLEIHANTPPEVYLTLFMSVLNPRQNELRYVNAGHFTQFAMLAHGEIKRMESTGRPLGLLPGGGYEERRIRFAAGDSLFLYTDGLVEATDAADLEYGQERLENLLLESRASNIHEILARVESEICRYRGDTEAADDATMLVLKFSSSSLEVEAVS
jgi:serine phosphatase RsbU (regulator of sigma subunit)